jgi:hypothetical protein
VDLTGWTPVRMEWEGTSPAVDWCRTDGIAFDDPFFDQTVERCFRHPFRLLFRHRSGMEQLRRWRDDHPGLPPAGFVFHMSRCGSTLVSQMLAAATSHLVLSECPPVDWVLRSGLGGPVPVDEATRSDWLRSVIAALGQRRDDRQRRLFVKFDAWSTVALPLVRRTFPDVPCLFLFRDPVEVLVSHSRRPGAHVIPGALPAEVLGVALPDRAADSRVDYAARVLARICHAALAHGDDPMVTFADYRRLPGLVTTGLLPAWGVTVDDEDEALMRQAAGRDAKNPVLAFLPDQERKQAEAGPDVEAAAGRWLSSSHEALQGLAARAPR